MNTLLHWLTSPEWALVVKALLHSLWQGAIVAIGVAILLRRITQPSARYRLAMSGLVLLMLGTIATWGVMNAPRKSGLAPAAVVALEPVQAAPATGPVERITVIAQRSMAPETLQWTGGWRWCGCLARA